MTPNLETWILSLAVAMVVLAIFLGSIYSIGPTEVGLVRKRFGAKLPGDNPLAFRGEAGYQAEMLMPGLRFKLWLVFAVTKHPWVQVPAGQIGVVIAQVGQPLPIGAKSAVYKPEFGNFTDLHVFIEKRGQKGVQRPVLSPGTLAPIHPAAFLVITKPEVFGVPISSDLSTRSRSKGELTYRAFGLEEKQLEVTHVHRADWRGSGRTSSIRGFGTSRGLRKAGCRPGPERHGGGECPRSALESNVPFVPNTLVMSGDGSGTLGGVLALLMRQIDAGLAPKPVPLKA